MMNGVNCYVSHRELGIRFNTLKQTATRVPSHDRILDRIRLRTSKQIQIASSGNRPIYNILPFSHTYDRQVKRLNITQTFLLNP